MFNIFGNAVFVRKNSPAGWFRSKTKVLDTSRNMPHPNGTKLYRKNDVFRQNSVISGYSQQKWLIKFKSCLQFKAQLSYPPLQACLGSSTRHSDQLRRLRMLHQEAVFSASHEVANTKTKPSKTWWPPANFSLFARL